MGMGMAWLRWPGRGLRRGGLAGGGAGGRGITLRQAGITLPILVLGFSAPERVAEAIANRISLAVHHPDLARDFAAQARALGQPLHVHAKFDTGMGRLGVFPEDGLEFVRQIHDQPGSGAGRRFSPTWPARMSPHETPLTGRLNVLPA